VNAIPDVLISGPVKIGPGTTAIDLVLSVPHFCPELREMTFLEYRPRPVLEERLPTSASQAVREVCKRASELRDLLRADIPLYDLAVASNLDLNDFDAVLKEMAYHEPDENKPKELRIKLSELTSGVLRGMQADAENNRAALGLVSLVRMANGEEAHLPLMDFRCSQSPENLNKIEACFRLFETRMPAIGCLLSTQRSYHFQGLTVLRHDAWIQFMARCLLLGPLADSRYIAHCLLHGKSGLRITKSHLHPDVPVVSAIVRR
jgi:hypothetical protein